jgi:hypothetical protein
MAKRKRTKGQTMIYKALHRKLTIEHHEPGDEPRLLFHCLYILFHCEVEHAGTCRCHRSSSHLSAGL